VSEPHPELVQALCAAEAVVIITGAGFSTASGIPDYRGPQGVWHRQRPVLYHDFLDDPEERRRDWELHARAWQVHGRAQPNPAHLALVRWEQAGRLEAVITQNIDGLHRRAGHAPERLIELHGVNDLVQCTRCPAREPAAPHYQAILVGGEPPVCPACGGWWKSAVVNFGQALRAEDVERAQEAILRTDLVIAAGSTLQVQPAASFPLLAARTGVPYIVINAGPTEHDGHPLVSLRLEQDLVDALPPALDAALAMRL
jgi:NAD-dependent deacetylase